MNILILRSEEEKMNILILRSEEDANGGPTNHKGTNFVKPGK